jgi:hypothetical protein
MGPRLTAKRDIFRPPLFAIFFAFLVEFYDSKTRLNIFADRELTINVWRADEYYRDISARYADPVPLTRR